MTDAFLDSGSEITIVEDKLMRKLGISGPIEKLKLKWSNQHCYEEPTSQRVQIYVTGAYKEETFLIKNARNVETLQLPLQCIGSDMINRFDHLKGIPFEDYTDACPEILIGLDNHSLMMPIEVVEGKPNDPVAIRTRLGWTIFGSSGEVDNCGHSINLHSSDNDKLHELVES